MGSVLEKNNRLWEVSEHQDIIPWEVQIPEPQQAGRGPPALFNDKSSDRILKNCWWLPSSRSLRSFSPQAGGKPWFKSPSDPVWNRSEGQLGTARYGFEGKVGGKREKVWILKSQKFPLSRGDKPYLGRVAAWRSQKPDLRSFCPPTPNCKLAKTNQTKNWSSDTKCTCKFMSFLFMT